MATILVQIQIHSQLITNGQNALGSGVHECVTRLHRGTGCRAFIYFTIDVSLLHHAAKYMGPSSHMFCAEIPALGQCMATIDNRWRQ